MTKTTDADTITKRAEPLAAAGPTCYQLDLLFDKHFGEQNALVDAIADRVQVPGGVSLAMAPGVAEVTLSPRAPRGREEVPVQVSRLRHARKRDLGSANDDVYSLGPR